MTAKELAKFREQLENQRTEVIVNLEEHAERLREKPSSGDHSGADLAKEQEDQQADVLIVESEERLVQKIEHALERIDAGTYGICEGCDGEIPIARLTAKPSVALCITCQEAHESE
jgi:DnaK suppressor protein